MKWEEKNTPVGRKFQSIIFLGKKQITKVIKCEQSRESVNVAGESGPSNGGGIMPCDKYITDDEREMAPPSSYHRACMRA